MIYNIRAAQRAAAQAMEEHPLHLRYGEGQAYATAMWNQAGAPQQAQEYRPSPPGVNQQVTPHEKLAERVASEVRQYHCDGYVSGADVARIILAEVLRTLETVTPEMEDAWNCCDGRAADHYLAMLRASPLKPSN